MRHLKERPAPPSAFNPDLTEEFSRFVLSMLAKKPQERPQNFHEVLIALKKIPQIYKSVKESPEEEAG
jgi:serine/threonine protein kinase